MVDVLTAFQANRQDPDALLDPKTGFASRLRDFCKGQYAQQSSLYVGPTPLK